MSSTWDKHSSPLWRVIALCTLGPITFYQVLESSTMSLLFLSDPSPLSRLQSRPTQSTTTGTIWLPQYRCHESLFVLALNSHVSTPSKEKILLFILSPSGLIFFLPKQALVAHVPTYPFHSSQYTHSAQWPVQSQNCLLTERPLQKMILIHKVGFLRKAKDSSLYEQCFNAWSLHQRLIYPEALLHSN